MTTVDPTALAAFNAAQRRAHIAYAWMPIATNRSHPTPCLRCSRPTRNASGFCKADCKREGKR